MSKYVDCYSGVYKTSYENSKTMKVLYFIFNIAMCAVFGFWVFIAVIGVSGSNAEVSGAYIALNSLAAVGWLYFVARIVKSLK